MYVRARIDYFEQEEQYQVKRLFGATTVGRAIIYNNNLRVENSCRLSNPLDSSRHATYIFRLYVYMRAYIYVYARMRVSIIYTHLFCTRDRVCVCTYTGTLEIGARSRIEDERPC